MTTLSPSERAAAGFYDGDHPMFTSMTATGHVVTWDPGAPFTRPMPAVILQAHLDGSMYVLPSTGSPICVEPHTVHGAPSAALLHRVNDYQLNDRQVQVLMAFAAAGSRGLTDLELTDPEDVRHTRTAGRLMAATSVRDRRRELIDRGLLAPVEGPLGMRASRDGKRGQVWVITQTGRAALRPSLPKALMDRYVAGVEACNALAAAG